jgi:RNA polymerase sigma-70 factor (ECF subfamily)
VLTGTAHGAEDVARLVTLLWSALPDAEPTLGSVNGRPGLIIRRAAGVAVIAVEAGERDIRALWIVLNPDKLHAWHRFAETT